MQREDDYEVAKSQMRKGMLEFCTLLIISRDKVYASDILSELKEANIIVVEGTLYPLLSRLKSNEYLKYDWEESASGPPRKYYTLTLKGKEKLSQLKATWTSLAKSITTLIGK